MVLNLFLAVLLAKFDAGCESIDDAPKGGRADVDHELKPLYDAIQETRSDLSSLKEEWSTKIDSITEALGTKEAASKKPPLQRTQSF